jgi:hypothetical protein
VARTSTTHAQAGADNGVRIYVDPPPGKPARQLAPTRRRGSPAPQRPNCAREGRAVPQARGRWPPGPGPEGRLMESGRVPPKPTGSLTYSTTLRRRIAGPACARPRRWRKNNARLRPFPRPLGDRPAFGAAAALPTRPLANSTVIIVNATDPTKVSTIRRHARRSAAIRALPSDNRLIAFQGGRHLGATWTAWFRSASRGIQPAGLQFHFRHARQRRRHLRLGQLPGHVLPGVWYHESLATS